jgi:predicted nucleotidyltransferase
MSTAGGSEATSADRGIGERLDLIDAAIYADLFDCAVTGEEMWRYSRASISRERLTELLESDPALRRLISGRGDLYCLRGREQLLEARGERRSRARQLHRRARAVARVLRHFPFVRGLLLTGSAGADDAPSGADLDLLVLVEPDRLATAFAILGTLSRLLGRETFCPNHYVATDALRLDGRRDIYVARELVQARPLSGAAEALRAGNEWVVELLPNALDGARPTAEPRPASRLQRLLERPCRGRGGDALERRLARLARWRLDHHYRGNGEPVPEQVAADFEAGRQLRFHGVNDTQGVLDRYERRRGELAASERS